MKAVLTGIDTHPAHSIALMLRSVGFDVFILSDVAIHALQSRGYKGGVEHEYLKSMGYSPANIPQVGVEALDDCDLFVDLREQYIDSFLKVCPRLEGKVLQFLINGGRDDYDSCGFKYPVATANMWVGGEAFKCYPPFDNVHGLKPRSRLSSYEPPIGLLHNAYNWGMKYLINPLIDKTGVRLYGSYGSPAGMLPNKDIGPVLATALCFIHPKSNDCPGYALYEAFASGVPIVCTELLPDRMKFHDLYEDDVTCLMWGRRGRNYNEEDAPTGIIRDWFEATQKDLLEQIVACVEILSDPVENERIGMGGYERWRKLTEWTPHKKDAFAEFLSRNKLL